MLRVVCLALLALLAAPMSLRAQGAGPCAVPEGMVALSESLPAVARALRRGEALTIVALGSSSTSGTGASRPEAAYPHQLALALAERFPGAVITVLNKGVAGDTAAQMLARIDDDVLAHTPQLVIWQSGTNDIINDIPLTRFIAEHRAGIARLKAGGADLLLLETQWSPRVIGKPGHLDYIHALRQLADAMDVPLLRRFDMMAYWLDARRMSAASMLADDQFHMCDASYLCLARQIATAIDRATPSRLTLMADGTN